MLPLLMVQHQVCGCQHLHKTIITILTTTVKISCQFRRRKKRSTIWMMTANPQLFQTKRPKDEEEVKCKKATVLLLLLATISEEPPNKDREEGGWAERFLIPALQVIILILLVLLQEMPMTKMSQLYQRHNQQLQPDLHLLL